MTQDERGQDPLWPRASAWLADGPGTRKVDVGVLGVPAHRTALSPTNAQATPAAIRAALARYTTWSSSREADLELLAPLDLGDVYEPDLDEEAVSEAAEDAAERARLVIALGGDNSITYGLARGFFAADTHKGGLITLDAQHGLRDGVNNGSPVRRLVEAGLGPSHIVQMGIADWANGRHYAERARSWGIRVTSRDEISRRGIVQCMRDALDLASRGGGGILVTINLDVCDRTVAPACPGSLPGGLSALEVRQAAFMAGQHQSVRGAYTSRPPRVGTARGRPRRSTGSGGMAGDHLPQLPGDLVVQSQPVSADGPFPHHSARPGGEQHDSLSEGTASRTPWVTNKTVVAVAFHTRSNSFCSMSRVIASRAANGSSISNSCGPLPVLVAAAIARANETRWRIPPDSSCGRLPATPSSRTSSSNSWLRRRRSAFAHPARCSASSTLRPAVSHGNGAASWNMNDGLRAAMVTVPLVASSRPAAMLSSVDFPHPEAPRTHMNSPWVTRRSTPRSAVTAPGPVPKTLETFAIFQGCLLGAFKSGLVDVGGHGLITPEASWT